MTHGTLGSNGCLVILLPQGNASALRKADRPGISNSETPTTASLAKSVLQNQSLDKLSSDQLQIPPKKPSGQTATLSVDLAALQLDRDLQNRRLSRCFLTPSRL